MRFISHLHLISVFILCLQSNDCFSFSPYSIDSSISTRIIISDNRNTLHVPNLLKPCQFSRISQSRPHSSSSILLAKKKSGNATFRADRVLSNRGWGSRSECSELLKQRRVFQKVDSKMERINSPSEKISIEASLWIDGKMEVPTPPPLLRVYNKPKWVLSVMNDSKGRKNVGDLDFISKMHPVGRLDYDTSGLLLFSSDGSLTQHLLHPNHKIEKEYVALVVGKADEKTLREKLAQGVTTSLGAFKANLIEAKSIPSDRVQPLIADIIDNLPEEYDLERLTEKEFWFFKDAKELSEVRLVVQEGKHIENVAKMTHSLLLIMANL
mmetsp:Transcript_4909/g.7406  ORF Transcript_4909/g.7406 Transcript_4909/m.7406 type:complete len:325 (-) Transcript_4909:287-1261(-)